jgi:hypothetical protein
VANDKHFEVLRETQVAFELQVSQLLHIAAGDARVAKMPLTGPYGGASDVWFDVGDYSNMFRGHMINFCHQLREDRSSASHRARLRRAAIVLG